ncbi:type I-E CRISPR-associated protein Cse2/CasB [Nocardiopsis quinghaiensis]|uniref:type I-E CRISPR-associated protein Cse2/CasB n=1 Tax=Nocardiopsis quinghaiensis TaxID=464995 RepID=UPI00123B5131|nr:type I-E CRISPR-associated protein Cse2/CasB [Nocardiopsis quinghaiensis]
MSDHPSPAVVGEPASQTNSAVPEQMQAARAFVDKIMERCAEDRGARAALRSGLGKPLDRVPRMHAIVAPLLPTWAMDKPDVQRAYYAAASMIALLSKDQIHTAQKRFGPDATTSGRYGQSLGHTLADAVASGTRKGLRESAAETRINLLTKQSAEGLHRHLPATIRQLQGADAPIDYARLITDLRSWRRYRGDISRRWLQDFYQTRFKADRDAAQQADTEADPAPQA